MSNQTIIANLEQLRDQIILQPEKLFDLNFYKQEEPCGTIFCSVGLAASMPHFIEQGLGFRLVKSYNDATEPSMGYAVSGYYAQINGVDVDDNGKDLDMLFGENAFITLFVPGGEGLNDYEFDDRHPDEFSDKELALARIEYVLNELKETK